MRKGELTKQAILQQAMTVASQVGLEGLTIGGLAKALDLSKSGLFAHFQSKDALQVQVLEFTADRFVDQVVRPALSAPRGEPRACALFEGELRWFKNCAESGGCVILGAISEYDDRAGPVRDRLVQLHRDLLDVVATMYRSGVKEGQFREDFNAEQFAHEYFGLMLAYQHSSRLMRDPNAERHVRSAFESLLARVRVTH